MNMIDEKNNVVYKWNEIASFFTVASIITWLIATITA